jgi:hypothetical protein
MLDTRASIAYLSVMARDLNWERRDGKLVYSPTYVRYTKIMKIDGDGVRLGIGDLVSLTFAGRTVEGEIVDIAAHRVGIAQADNTISWHFACSLSEDNVVCHA